MVDIPDLIARCTEVRQRAYAPYSNYFVGAAIVTDAGVFSGCNVENASYGLTICAERSAIAAAVSSGARRIHALAVATSTGGSPCGACRQVMQEFSQEDTLVICVDETGEIKISSTVGEILPFAFTSAHLEQPFNK